MGFCNLSEVSSFLSFAKLHYSASCSTHRGPSKPRNLSGWIKTQVLCPEPHWVEPSKAGRRCHVPWLGPPNQVLLLFTPAKNKKVTWSQIIFPRWLSQWVPGASKLPPTRKHLSFSPHTMLQQNKISHVKGWSTHFHPAGFLKNEGEALIYWDLPALLYDANRFLGLVAALSFMFCGQGHTYLGWRAKSGILTVNFLVFNRLRSKDHVLSHIHMNNFHWCYSCISEFS